MLSINRKLGQVAIRSQLEADCIQEKRRTPVAAKSRISRKNIAAQNLNFQRTNMLKGTVSMCASHKTLCRVSYF
jgi:hypothetical protein